MKKTSIEIAKIVIPTLIILWLLWSVDPDQFHQLRDRPKDWGRLFGSFSLVFLAVAISFVRWHMLVRALGMTFRLRDAFRLGFLGFLFNFVSVGAVGGDLFKAFFIARDQPGRRTEAVATVVVDRVVGVFGLLLATCIAILLSDLSDSPAIVKTICHMTFIATGIGIAGILLLLWPGLTRGPLVDRLIGLPRIGGIIEKLVSALGMYRGKPLVMISAFVMSGLVHCLLALSVFLIATALFRHTPTLGEHFLIVPLSNVAGALPFAPAGLGQFEFAMNKLFELVPRSGSHDVVGILVALTYRLNMVAVTAVGVVYYWSCRSEIRDVMEEAEKAEDGGLKAKDGWLQTEAEG